MLLEINAASSFYTPAKYRTLLDGYLFVLKYAVKLSSTLRLAPADLH